MENKNYYFVAKEPFLIREYVERVANKKGISNIIYTWNTEDFFEKMDENSIFEDKDTRIVVNWLDENNIEIIYEFLQSPREVSTILIDEGGLSKAKSYSKLKTLCEIITIDKLTVEDITVWIQKYLTGKGIKYDPDIPSLLITRKDKNLYAIYKEMNKLILIAKEGVLSKKVCLGLVSSIGETKFFDFSDNFFRRRVKESIQELDKIDPESYIGLNSFLISSIEKVYRVALYKEQKMSEEDIASLLELPKFIVRTKYIPPVAAFGKTRLLKIIDILTDLDIKLKSMRINKKDLFTFTIAKCLKL